MAKRRNAKSKSSRKARTGNTAKPRPSGEISTMTWQGHGAAALTHLGAAGLSALKVKLGLNTEEKFVDVNFTTAVTTTLVQKGPSATIPQGITVNSREGGSIRVENVEYRLNFQAAAAGTPCTARIIIVRDKDSGNMTAANILQTSTDINSPFNNLFSALGLELLCDDEIFIGAPGSDFADVQWNRVISRPDLHMRWTNADTTGVPADLVQGQLATWIMYSQAGVPPTLSGISRFWYVDN